MKSAGIYPLIGIAVIPLDATVSAAPKQDRKMNILFIAADDLKPVTGAYGDPHAITPALDGLAAQGATFINCYTQQALSAPSRSSLLTGMRPDKTRVWDLVTDFRQVNPNAVSLPEYLKKMITRIHTYIHFYS